MVDQGCVIDEIDALTSATDIRLLPDVAMELKRDLAFQGVEEPDFDKLIASEKRFPIRIQSLANQIPQFEDVPTDHWAAKAVLELRRLGILMGYPDGKFKG